MNKRGQAAPAIFLALILILIGLWFASANPYNTYKADCRNIYKKDFQINSTCYSGTVFLNNTSKVPCQKTDWDSLDKFCLDAYNNKGDEQ